MIATNYRRFADALIAQMELDLSGSADDASRAAWWDWLMQAGTPQATPKRVLPRWLALARRSAKKLAKAVKLACRTIFEAMASMHLRGRRARLSHHHRLLLTAHCQRWRVTRHRRGLVAKRQDAGAVAKRLE